MRNIFILILRTLFALIDGVVGWAIKNLYILLVQIANTNVFGDFIYQMLGRIYVFLGIFMLFKLSMSMITYIINPDAFADKGKGFGKLITNVIISLILIVTVPTLFKEAFRLQSIILNTNAIYQIVTGHKLPAADPSDTTNQMMENAASTGKQIVWGVYSPFIYKDEEIDNIAEVEEVSPPVKNDSNDKCANYDSDCMLDVNTLTLEGDGEHGFANNYTLILGTLCGGAVAYFFLVFCLDTATRAIKLGMLQIVAPIPILSMIDPSVGTKKLKTWAGECGKEFAGLFIRLAGVYFAVSVITLIIDPSKMGVNNAMTYFSGGRVSLFVKLFIIIGALMFAKQFPQWVESVLGFKLSGDGFNLKKRMSGMPGLGLAKAVGAGALGFAGGMTANMLAARKNFGWDKNKGFWKNMGSNALGGVKGVGSMAAGGVSGMGRGAFSKEKSMWKAGATGIKGAVDKRNLRDQRRAAGDGGLPGYVRRAGVAIDNWSGVESGAAKFDRQLSSYDEFLKIQSGLMDYAGGKVEEDWMTKTSYQMKWTDSAGNVHTASYNENVNELSARLEQMKNDPTARAQDIAMLQARYKQAKEQASIDYITKNKNDGGAVENMLSDLEYMRKSNSNIGAEISNPIIDGAGVISAKKTIKGARSRTTSSEDYRKAQANKKKDGK